MVVCGWLVPSWALSYQIILLVILFGISVYSSHIVEADLMEKLGPSKGHDAGKIVIDELAGMTIALVAIPNTWIAIVAAFILFRLFDITKPFPINKLQHLPGGWGITMDDVVAGIYAIHLKSFSADSVFEPLRAMRGSASIWALSTGATIAGYSLVDKVGVGLVYPPAYIYLMFVISLLLLSPYMLTRERAALKLEWRVNRGPILIDGFLVLLTYLIILFAFRLSKVSYVVAAREVSIVISALLGIIWLKEAHAPQKLAGSVLIALGVVFIGLSK